MRSILADIASPPTISAGARPRDPVREVRDAVLAVLRLLIATRRGTVWPDLDFGIEDPTGIFQDYPGSVEEFRSALEAAILRHEPRLTRPSVTQVRTDDLMLRLDIEGTLVTRERRVPVKFSTRIDGAWNAEVR